MKIEKTEKQAAGSIEQQVEDLIYTHEIDWYKVNTLGDIKSILSCMLGAVDPNDKDIKTISHLLKKR